MQKRMREEKGYKEKEQNIVNASLGSVIKFYPQKTLPPNIRDLIIQ